MPTVPLNITGGSHTKAARLLSAQVTRNFYPEVADDPAVHSPFVLRSFPGMTLFGTAPSGHDRGLFVHKNVLYHVSGQTIYSVNKLGTHTSLGALPGVDRCIFAGIGSNVVIVSEGRVFQYNGATVAEITDSDLEMPNSCAHLNQQMIYDGDGGRFVSSDVGDAASIDGLNYATAESEADDLVRVFTFGQSLYLFGEETIETWYNTGDTTNPPPFDRIEGGIIPIGLAALHSVSANDTRFYWLGDDREVYAGAASQAQRVSSSTISRAVRLYDRVDDAIGWCSTWNGTNYYTLTFPQEDATWCYTEGGQWFELSSGDLGGRWRANSYAHVYGKRLVSEHGTGNVLELVEDVYTENGDAVLRERTSGPLHGGLLGAPGKSIEMARFELLIETGQAIDDAEIMLSFSDDGGQTWGTERRDNLGAIGDFQTTIEWHSLGRFVNRLIRVRCSDPIPLTIVGAAADLEVTI